MLGFNGGLLGVRKVPTTGSASGLWMPNEQSVAQRAGIWPITDPYWNNVSLLLHMDGSNGSTTFTDSSSNVASFTANGNAQISTTQSKFGGASASFDGNGDYLTTSLSATLQLGSGDFTVECWTYLTARVSSYPCLWGNYDSYTTGALSLFAGHGSSSATLYQVAVNGAAFPVIQSSTSIIYNTWVHLAVVRYSGTITLYVDGIANGAAASTAALDGVGSSFCIGTAFDNIANGYIQGYLDEFRITKGVARYTANFTPPAAPFPNG